MARKFDVTTDAVSCWKKTWKERGKRALRGVPHPGRPSELSDAQRENLMNLLDHGAIGKCLDRQDHATRSDFRLARITKTGFRCHLNR